MSTDSQVIDVADGRKKLYGILLICAINLSHKSVFKQIIKLVEEIQTSKASIQVLADKTVGYIVPIIIGLYPCRR
ncbi:unnamed protein product [Rotaria sordida]|uniref:Uncharacterized protein n=1 Tax=Rotaria sordida TaxID=392033 RepID=A0A819K4V7_9BILA|nr:unnamed protein product [Rotaria sordida]